jgi:hypothetical protein
MEMSGRLLIGYSVAVSEWITQGADRQTRNASAVGLKRVPHKSSVSFSIFAGSDHQYRIGWPYEFTFAIDR